MPRFVLIFGITIFFKSCISSSFEASTESSCPCDMGSSTFFSSACICEGSSFSSQPSAVVGSFDDSPALDKMLFASARTCDNDANAASSRSSCFVISGSSIIYMFATDARALFLKYSVASSFSIVFVAYIVFSTVSPTAYLYLGAVTIVHTITLVIK